MAVIVRPEDRVDGVRYNRILRSGIMGDYVLYSSAGSGRDLRLNR